MSAPPLVSVVTPTHGGAHRLPALLTSLEAQDVEVSWEVVVVVDGHDKHVERLLAREQERLPLRVVVHPEALGVAAALTTGFAHAHGTYLVRCDDDLTLPRGFLRGHLQRQGDRSDLVVLSPTRDVFSETPYARAYGRPANERALMAAARRPADKEWTGLAACFSMHRRAWTESGGFDPRFAYREDSEFGYRLFCKGFTIMTAPELTVDHRGPALTASNRVPRSFVSGASLRLFRTVHPEALKPTRPSGWWGRLLTAIAWANRSPRRYAVLGSCADRALGVLPRAVGHKLVAALVEAAALSGERYGSTDLHAYRGQKDAELRAERTRQDPSAPSTLG